MPSPQYSPSVGLDDGAVPYRAASVRGSVGVAKLIDRRTQLWPVANASRELVTIQRASHLPRPVTRPTRELRHRSFRVIDEVFLGPRSSAASREDAFRHARRIIGMPRRPITTVALMDPGPDRRGCYCCISATDARVALRSDDRALSRRDAKPSKVNLGPSWGSPSTSLLRRSLLRWRFGGATWEHS